MAESGTNRRDSLTGDERLLDGLLRGESLVEAAAASGLPERTARRHAAAPEFRGRLDEARRELTAVLAVQLQADAEVGRRVLRGLAEDESVAPAVRANAARYLIGFASDFGPTRDLEARIEQLEVMAGVDPESGWRRAAA